MVTAVVVPLLVVLLVLANVRGGGDDDDPPVMVSGPASTAAGDLPVLDVEAPPLTPEADAACPALMTNLPTELAGERFRHVRSDTPYVYAWSEPAVVLRCGVERPVGFVAGGPQLFLLDGVSWFVDDSDPDVYVWTAVDRAVYVELTVPGDSAPVVALSSVVAATLPYREPQPGP